MASTSIRWNCLNEILTGVKNMPMASGAETFPGWPGDEAPEEFIWVYTLDGEVDIPVMSAGRKQRDDVFVIPLQVKVTGKTDLDRTMGRLTELVSSIEDYMAEHSTIGDFDGVVSAQITQIGMTSGETLEGPVGFGEVQIEVHSRLT